MKPFQTMPCRVKSYEATLKYSKEAGIIWEKYPN